MSGKTVVVQMRFESESEYRIRPVGCDWIIMWEVHVVMLCPE